MKYVIEVKKMSMSFNVLNEKVTSLKEFFIKFLKGNIKYRKFNALNNINFSIQKGEVVGLIGFNGAGKSTLLKLISGVLTPTEGSVTIEGRIAPLIELGAGFDPELTGRENVVLNSKLLGFSKKEIKDRMDSIIEFSELKDFIDIPLKNYSSGMLARLGFSIATSYTPEVLIVDEVLSVGDFHFQEKSIKKIHDMIQGGTTVFFVSHNIQQVRELCTRVIWIDNGNLKADGDVESITEEYMRS
jgi:ABC-2 type transport system ATP-binding protein